MKRHAAGIVATTVMMCRCSGAIPVKTTFAKAATVGTNMTKTSVEALAHEIARSYRFSDAKLAIGVINRVRNERVTDLDQAKRKADWATRQIRAMDLSIELLETWQKERDADPYP